MKIERSYLRIGQLSLSLGLSLTLTAGAFAQEAADDEDNAEPTEKVERIRVTGSRIRQLDVEGPRPITVIDRKQIEASGTQNLNEYLNRLTIASFGSGEYGSGYGVSPGTQSVNLRGLGSDNTLVLLNGKRIVKDPYLEINDLSVIPTAAIDRVEILKGTASAIYGTDALGGVVNIITRDDFDGFGAGYKRIQPRYPGGARDQAYAVAGSNSENSSNVLVLQWDQSQPIHFGDRPWVDRNYRSVYGYPFSYIGQDGEEHRASDCVTAPEQADEGRCRYNYMDELALEDSWQKLSLLDDFTYDITDRTTLNLRTFLNYKTSTTEPTKAFVGPTERYTVSEDYITNNYADILNRGDAAPMIIEDPNMGDQRGAIVRGRLTGYKGSYTHTKELTASGTLGITHEFDGGELLEVSFADSRMQRNHNWLNRFDDQALREAIFNGTYDIFSANPGDLSPYLTDATSLDRSTSRIFETTFSGDLELFQNFWGYAFGVSHLYESYNRRPSRHVVAETVKGLGGGGGDGYREAVAAFGELSIPITPNLETNLAARYDEYSDFGDTFNPQVSVQYRPLQSVFFRMNYGSGFKAPTLSDIHDEQALYFTSFTDYVLCNQAREDNDAKDIEKYCEFSRSADIRTGGNPELEPEKSTSWSATLGYEPVTGTGIRLEYFNTKIEDVITSVSADDLLKLAANGKTLPAGTSIIRNDEGDVDEVVSPTVNLSTSRTEGLDTSVYWSDNFTFGNLSYRSVYSYYLKYEIQRLPGADYESELERSGQPRWRWNNRFGYGIGDHQFQLLARSNGRYHKGIESEGYVGSWTSWDFNWTWDVTSYASINAGGNNIFNEPYPYDNTSRVTKGVGGSFYPNMGPTFHMGVDFTL
jgi:iron complex outermembrane receptor protein